MPRLLDRIAHAALLILFVSAPFLAAAAIQRAERAAANPGELPPDEWLQLRRVDKPNPRTSERE